MKKRLTGIFLSVLVILIMTATAFAQNDHNDIKNAIHFNSSEEEVIRVEIKTIDVNDPMYWDIVNRIDSIKNDTLMNIVPFGATCGANAGHTLRRTDVWTHIKGQDTCYLRQYVYYNCEACTYGYSLGVVYEGVIKRSDCPYFH